MTALRLLPAIKPQFCVALDFWKEIQIGCRTNRHTISTEVQEHETLVCSGGNKMAVQWNKDADAALAEAKTNKKPVLVDFSAAPA